MKLAFNGSAHYPDLSKGYERYKSRTKSDRPIDKRTYNRIIKSYCELIAQRLVDEGSADFPCGLGTVVAAVLTRKPQYRGDKFVGYGGWDWKNKQFDGKLKTFGIVFLPRWNRCQNLRCYGFVANRQLFNNVKQRFREYTCRWTAMNFNDDMI